MPDAGAVDPALSRHGPGGARHRQSRNEPGGLLTPAGGAEAEALAGRIGPRLAAAPPGPLAVGFSGGGDSAALLRLSADWARGAGRALYPLIVDHGLRPGSAADAERAAQAARMLGLEPRILRWDGPKPQTGLQEAARRARLILLAQGAREAGAEAVLLAHTEDDQAETVWLRIAAGSAWRGLAAMRTRAPWPLWPEGRGLVALRPLLDTPRAALRAFLSAQGAEWIEDPANEDARHARVRARRTLARLPAARRRLLAAADHAGALARAEDALARRLAETALTAPPDGTLRIAREALDAPGAGRLLQAALTAAAGAGRGPPMEAVEALLVRLRTGAGGTLGGAAAAPRGRSVVLHRDPGALLGRAGVAPLPPAALAPGAPAAWDGRFDILTHEPDLEVRPLGEAWRDLPEAARAALKPLPEGGRAGLPGLWRAGRLVCAPIPGFGAGIADLQPLAFERFERLLFAPSACSYGAKADIGTRRELANSPRRTT